VPHLDTNYWQVHGACGRCGAKTSADLSLSIGLEEVAILQKTKFDDAVSSGAVKISGDQIKLRDLVSYLDTFEFWFNIVTPNAMARGATTGGGGTAR
jgi:alkyl sulfatase BDS1-like metallo-beta-lactamase superfamily hydrolase